MRAELQKKDARATVVNMLDEVAWLLNLRGSDIEYNPVFFAYALVDADADGALLFVDEKQLDPAVSTHLGETVEVRPYASFFGYLRELGAKQGVSLSRAFGRSAFSSGGFAG